MYISSVRFLGCWNRNDKAYSLDPYQTGPRSSLIRVYTVSY